MIPLNAIMYDYFTIIRLFHRLFHRLFCDYFTIIRDYFTDYTRLFHGVSTRKMGMCRQQFLTQSRRNDWSVSMKNACASVSTGRLADRMESAWWSVPALLYALFFLIYALFVLAEPECGLCRYVLRTVLLCTPILSVTTSFWNIGEAAVAVESAQPVPFICDYFPLF